MWLWEKWGANEDNGEVRPPTRAALLQRHVLFVYKVLAPCTVELVRRFGSCCRAEGALISESAACSVGSKAANSWCCMAHGWHQ